MKICAVHSFHFANVVVTVDDSHLTAFSYSTCQVVAVQLQTLSMDTCSLQSRVDLARPSLQVCMTMSLTCPETAID